MKILISGANGFIGSALANSLERSGHKVLRLSRKKTDRSDRENLNWTPAAKEFPKSEREKLVGVEAAFHLSGENVFGRWTQDKKRRILQSRVQSTSLLSATLAELPVRPRVLICASAVGYYGDRADEILHEESTSGNDFLANVCREWEAAADPAREVGIRVVHARFGVVLSNNGGALQKILLPFKLGLGGPIGSGQQYFSWVSLGDAVNALCFALESQELSGAMNVVAPETVTNRAFTKTLSQVLRRPAVVPLPAFVLRIAFGKESADQTLLASQRAVPKKLESHGFLFQHSTLKDALQDTLKTAK